MLRGGVLFVRNEVVIYHMEGNICWNDLVERNTIFEIYLCCITIGSPNLKLRQEQSVAFKKPFHP